MARAQLDRKHTGKAVAVLLLLVFLAPLRAQTGAVPRSAGPPGRLPSIDSGDLETFLDALVEQQMNQLHVPGLVCAFVQDGRVLLLKGYGIADLEEGTAMSPDRTLMRVGSVSKLFTTTVLLQLQERGRVDLDQDANRYLARFQVPPTFPRAVSLAHLLTHTAGFDEKGIGALARSEDRIVPLGNYLAAELPPRVMSPGKTISYSNHGMALAGFMAEQVSGISFSQLVATRILKPLGMERTSFSTRSLPPEDFAAGYEYGPRGYRQVPEQYLNVAPAGSLVTTASDLIPFMLAHLNLGRLGEVRILEERTARTMQAQQFTQHPALPGFGFGFYEYFRNGRRALLHGGSLPGYASLVLLIPAERFGLFIGYNRLEHRLNEELVTRLFDRYFPPPALPARRHTSGPLTELATLEGSYRWNRYSRTTVQKWITFNRDFRITSDGSSLTLHYPPHLAGLWGPTRWFETGPLYFERMDGEQGGMAFGRDEKGALRLFLQYRGFFPVTLEKLPWHQSSRFQILVAVLAVAGLASPAAAWPLLLPRRRRARQPATLRRIRLLMALVPSASLFFVLSLRASLWLVSPWEFGHGIPPLFHLLLMIPAITLLLTAILLAHLAACWKSPDWGTADRVMGLAIVSSSLLFLWFLSCWNLIGIGG